MNTHGIDSNSRLALDRSYRKALEATHHLLVYIDSVGKIARRLEAACKTKQVMNVRVLRLDIETIEREFPVQFVEPRLLLFRLQKP